MDSEHLNQLFLDTDKELNLLTKSQDKQEPEPKEKIEKIEYKIIETKPEQKQEPKPEPNQEPQKQEQAVKPKQEPEAIKPRQKWKLKNTTRLNINIETEIYNRLKALAEKNKTTLAEFIRTQIDNILS